MPYSLRMSRRALLLPACAAIAIGAVGVALVLQHGFGMEPCAWCTFQRLVFLVVAALALLAWALGAWPLASRGASLLTSAAALGGLWAALHQQFVAARAQSCVFTLADRVLMNLRLDEAAPWLFEATASCSDANVPLLGVPFAAWSAATFTLLAAMALLALHAAPRGRGAAPLPVTEVSR